MINALVIESEISVIQNKILALEKCAKDIILNSFTMDIALECEALAPSDNILKGYFSGDSKAVKQKIALEGIISGIKKFIVAMFEKIIEHIKKIVDWFKGKKETSSPEEIKKHEKNMHDINAGVKHPESAGFPKDTNIKETIDEAMHKKNNDLNDNISKRIATSFQKLTSLRNIDILSNGPYTKAHIALANLLTNENPSKMITDYSESFFKLFTIFHNKAIALDDDNTVLVQKHAGDMHHVSYDNEWITLDKDETFKQNKHKGDAYTEWRDKQVALIGEMNAAWDKEVQPLVHKFALFSESLKSTTDEITKFKNNFNDRTDEQNKGKEYREQSQSFSNTLSHDIGMHFDSVRRVIHDINAIEIAESKEKNIAAFENFSKHLVTAAAEIFQQNMKDKNSGNNTESQILRFFHHNTHETSASILFCQRGYSEIKHLNDELNQLDCDLLHVLESVVEYIDFKARLTRTDTTNNQKYNDFKASVIEENKRYSGKRKTAIDHIADIHALHAKLKASNSKENRKIE